MNKTCLLAILFTLILHATYANPGDTAIERKKYFTSKTTTAITLDGMPTEDAWKQVEWGGDFIQNKPNEGKPPSQPTSFKILYDESYLYIAYWAQDSAPDSIIKRMGRRDEFPGDWVEINIDTYHDLRTAFSFTFSVSGAVYMRLAKPDRIPVAIPIITII